MSNEEFETWLKVLAWESHMTVEQYLDEYKNDQEKILGQIHRFSEQMNSGNNFKRAIYEKYFGTAN